MKKPKKTEQRTAARRRRFGSIAKRVSPGGKVMYLARWHETRGGNTRTRFFDTRKAALEFLDDIFLGRLAAARGQDAGSMAVAPSPPAAPGATPTFLEYARRVIEEKIAPVRSKQTVALYRRNLAVAVGFFGARREGDRTIPAALLTDINTGTLFSYRAWRKAQKRYARKAEEVSNSTVNRDVQFVSVVLTHAVQDGLLLRNPALGVKDLKLKEPRLGRRWLSKEEAGRLIHAAEGLFRIYVVAALTTGCRPQEIKALQWSDVDFDGDHLHIFRRKVGVADALPLHPALKRKLRALRRLRPDAKPEHFIFVNPASGEPWVDFRRAWRRALEAAAIPNRRGLSLYSLRHSFATHFLEGGGAITDLKSLLGHSDIATTQLYAAPVDARRRESVLKLTFKRRPVDEATTTGKEPSTPDGSGRVGEQAA